MIIVDKIRTILNSMLPPQTPVEGTEYVKYVMYDSSFSANVRIDRNPSPIALLYLLSDWQIDVSRGTKKEGAEIQVFFADRAKFDCKGEDKDSIVKRMETLALDFISRVLAEKSLAVVDDTVKMRSSYGQFDAFMVGVSVTLRLEERQGSCI